MSVPKGQSQPGRDGPTIKQIISLLAVVPLVKQPVEPLKTRKMNGS